MIAIKTLAYLIFFCVAKCYCCEKRPSKFRMSSQYSIIRTGPIWLFSQSKHVKSHINIATGNNIHDCDFTIDIALIIGRNGTYRTEQDVNYGS